MCACVQACVLLTVQYKRLAQTTTVRSIDHLLKSFNLCPNEYAGNTVLLGSCLTYPTPDGSAYLPGPGPAHNESLHFITTLAITQHLLTEHDSQLLNR